MACGISGLMQMVENWNSFIFGTNKPQKLLEHAGGMQGYTSILVEKTLDAMSPEKR